MALKIDRRSIAEGLVRGASGAKGTIAGAAGVARDKAATAAGTAGAAIASSAAAASERAAQAIRDGRERWYSPLFPEDYFGEGFDMPKLVVIADEDERKGNDVCEGAVGWLNARRVPEIMFMYEEFVPRSGIRFSPRPMCGGVYYRHPFEADLYLQVKDYLRTCKSDQLTELKDIACLLGATRCSVEVHQERGLVGTLSAARSASTKGKVDGVASSANASHTVGSDFSASEVTSIVMSESFESGATPRRPKLQWFEHDKEILSLIEKRCNPDAGGVMSSYSIDITSSTAASISVKDASSIDASLGAAKAKAGGSLSAGLKEEEKKRFIYRIEF